jgi:hypothetical protein
MSRRKKIGALLLSGLIVAVLWVCYQSRLASHDLGTGGGFAVESVSLINLIATPERYDGKWVRVEGVCAFEFENCALFLTQDDRKHFFSKNAVWADYHTLGLSNDRWDLPFMSKFDGRHVLVEGYFSSHRHGHFGMYSGAITNVTRIATH